MKKEYKEAREVVPPSLSFVALAEKEGGATSLAACADIPIIGNFCYSEYIGIL